MKFILGSKSERKINSVRNVIKEFVKGDFELLGYPAESNVSETPWDKETFDGARNRALNCKSNIKADYYMGVESGLVERYGHVYEESWCAVIDKDRKEFFGFSSGLKVPDFIINKMDKLKVPHSEVMSILEGEFEMIEAETWGNYSGGVISREVSLAEATRNAMIQVFPHKNSFYNK